MNKYTFTFVACCMAINIFAQSNISQPMNFHIEKDVVPPLLHVVPLSQTFLDEDNNGVIDANENCVIRFEVMNEGRGDGYGCIARVTTNGNMDGIHIAKEIALPVIPRGNKVQVEVPIKANANTQTGEMEFSIVVDEPNGYGTDPITGKIGTHKLKIPFIQVVSYKIVGETGGKLNRREPFRLQVIVQNTDQGIAENVTVGLLLPNNVNWLGGTDDHLTIGTLKPNESKTLEYELMANQRAEDEIDIQLALAEKTGRYAQNADIPLQFGQYIGATITMKVERRDEDVEIQKASLIADVDENIPVTSTKNLNTFVLIIANEHYQRVAPVPYALNDGSIFREYCIKTLGIGEKRIHYLADATYNQIRAEIQWLKNIAETFDDPQIILYYAGHGIPDEKNLSSYLLPIDGSGTDVSTGYKLDDLYAALGKMPASQITVFMDACFSGSKREEGMIASARAVALKVLPGQPQGNMVVFSASQGDETAYPYTPKQHGMFTYYLLKKLQETQGDVTLQDLEAYLSDQVRKQSLLENNRTQTPTVTPSYTLGSDWQLWTLK